MTENAVQLHQTLHGYGDGHQLLSSSIRLTREQQWQLLVMSDLSGPAFRAGFETYLTGYPLEGGGFYCLARTWFAPELSRPGCVWTHTFLISDTDLARIQDFRPLLSSFRRPASNKDVSAYMDPIHQTPSTFSQRYELNQVVGASVLLGLYGSPSDEIVLASDKSSKFEDLVIAVFSQQWPRLRRSFRFCTGALTTRDLEFDLAIVPRTGPRPYTRIKKELIIDPLGANVGTEGFGEDWVRAALDDLSSADSNANFRKFLWTFGPDYNDGRKAFRPLCEIHLAASRSADSVDQVLSAISHFFPEPTSGKRLKAEFFGISGKFARSSEHGEYLVLQALVAHPAAACVAEDTAAIESRARALVDSDDESAIRIAMTATSVGGTRAEQFLDGLGAGVISRPEILHRLPSALTFDLVKRLPTLLTFPELWKTSAEQQLTIIAQLPSLQSIPGFGKAITEAALASSAWSSLASVLARFGEESVDAILEWIDGIQRIPLSIPEPVYTALGEQRNLVIRVISRKTVGPRALRVASALLDPRATSVRALGSRVWAGATKGNICLAAKDAELRSRAFVLSLGLSISGPGDVELVSDGFSIVYNAARRNELNQEVWSFVEPYLPWYLVTWDRCARLIRGVVRRFLDRAWPAAKFVSTFRTDEEFRRALKDADATREGTQYIHQICEFVRAGSIKVDTIRGRALAEYCDIQDAENFMNS